MVKKIMQRALNEEFLNEFFENDYLNSVLKIIQNDNSLIMCLRGNYTTVYYRGLQILKIKQNFTFDVDKNYGIEIVPSLKCNWLEYFKEAKNKIDEHCSKGQAKLEKEIQQILFRENSCNSIADETDYFVIDLEYAHGQDRFDLIAVFWDRKDRAVGKKTQLAIIELKAGIKAIKGNASLSKHYIGVKNFIENIDKQVFLDDMKQVFIQMKKLGLINTKANPNKISIDKNPIQFIFALANYNDNSRILGDEIDKIPFDKNASFKTLFATSPYLGYGLYEKCMLGIDEIQNKLKPEDGKEC